MAEYIGSEIALVADWTTEGTAPGASMQTALQSGAQLVWVMETQRFGVLEEPKPIREAYVVKGIIKGADSSGNVAYLMMQDEKTDEYQFIGGHMGRDETPATAMRREVCEELPGRLVPDKDFTAWEVGYETEFEKVSPTYGALTHFHITVFVVNLMGNAPRLSQRHRWVSKEELMEGRTTDGEFGVFEDYVAALDKSIPGGLDGLPATAAIDSPNSKASLLSRLKDPDFDLWRWVIVASAIAAIVGTALALLAYLGGK